MNLSWDNHWPNKIALSEGSEFIKNLTVHNILDSHINRKESKGTIKRLQGAAESRDKRNNWSIKMYKKESWKDKTSNQEYNR